MGLDSKLDWRLELRFEIGIWDFGVGIGIWDCYFESWNWDLGFEVELKVVDCVFVRDTIVMAATEGWRVPVTVRLCFKNCPHRLGANL